MNYSWCFAASEVRKRWVWKKKKKKGSQIASQMLAGIQNLSLVDSPVVYIVFFNR